MAPSMRAQAVFVNQWRNNGAPEAFKLSYKLC
jgi:hypothetical protein